MCIYFNRQLALVLNVKAQINGNSINHENWVIILYAPDKTIMEVIFEVFEEI
jgi:hypothetical protein